ncbi:hypothetical protein D3C81_1594370 [compost metagenome]
MALMTISSSPIFSRRETCSLSQCCDSSRVKNTSIWPKVFTRPTSCRLTAVNQHSEATELDRLMRKTSEGRCHSFTSV